MGSKTWADHWETDDTPWDAGCSAPALSQLLKQWPISREEPPAGSALVAGCGSGYDVFSLAKAGYRARGIDLAPGVAPRFSALRSQAKLSDEQARLHVADFFESSPESVGAPYDLIWDYTFYCAIEPKSRDAWAAQMARLLKPSGRLAMLIFPVIPEAPKDEGPPFPLDPEEVTKQISQHFTRLHLEAVHESSGGREGKEWLAIFERSR